MDEKLVTVWKYFRWMLQMRTSASPWLVQLITFWQMLISAHRLSVLLFFSAPICTAQHHAQLRFCSSTPHFIIDYVSLSTLNDKLDDETWHEITVSRYLLFRNVRPFSGQLLHSLFRYSAKAISMRPINGSTNNNIYWVLCFAGHSMNYAWCDH